MGGFPLTEILDLLAMVKGQKPFAIKAAGKDVVALLSFALDQFPDAPVPPVKIDDPLVAGLETLAAHHDAHGADPAKLKAFNFDWKSFAQSLFQFALSKILPMLG